MNALPLIEPTGYSFPSVSVTEYGTETDSASGSTEITMAEFDSGVTSISI